MNIFKVFQEWLLKYEPLNNWIYFNATPVILGVASLNAVSGERVVKSFITGDKLKENILAIDMVTPYDATGTSDINMTALSEVEAFANWIEEKDNNKELPILDEHNTMEKIEILNNVPNLLVDPTNQLAKYQFQVRLTYRYREEID